MRILGLERNPLRSILYLNAARRGGTVTESLPLLRCKVDYLPKALDGLLLTSDLQGVVPDWNAGGEPRLLGENLAATYEKLASEGLVPAPARTGVILAGDFYSAPDAAKRGATGDVRNVWRAFGAAFRWTVGVAGNHDQFGSAGEERKFKSHPGIQLLDGEIADLDGLRVAGVGYVSGDPQKPGRREEAHLISLVSKVSQERPEVLVLHEAPRISQGQPGNQLLREELERSAVPLVVCGHKRWTEPLAEISPHQQIVNVNACAIILTLSG